TTYAGGRYLLDTIKGADLGTRNGRVVLDFNFAYNPSCSYSDRWVCPLSPPTNRLPEPVAAGERLRSASIPGWRTERGRGVGSCASSGWSRGPERAAGALPGSGGQARRRGGVQA